ncbi:MAG: hypothetical protein NMNS01_17230 [Nitrosomonas sp.]|jgi:hypothetical protein|nr:MAG: hypothetical protein NMNS01_17230 [Nitrosomonas sp.]
MTTRKVSAYFRILGKEPEHQDLFLKVDKLNEIQQSLLTIIPPRLAEHCAAGYPNDGKLTIFASNGSIAAKLKQISPSLLQKMQNLGWEVTSIQIATQAHYQASNTDHFNPKKRNLAQSGIASLTQLAASLPASALKTAIESLLKNR